MRRPGCTGRIAKWWWWRWWRWNGRRDGLAGAAGEGDRYPNTKPIIIIRARPEPGLIIEPRCSQTLGICQRYEGKPFVIDWYQELVSPCIFGLRSGKLDEFGATISNLCPAVLWPSLHIWFLCEIWCLKLDHCDVQVRPRFNRWTPFFFCLDLKLLRE